MSDDGRAIRTTREHALAVFCPTCRAAPDAACVNQRGQEREHLHERRHERAVALGAPRNRRVHGRRPQLVG